MGHRGWSNKRPEWVDDIDPNLKSAMDEVAEELGERAEILVARSFVQAKKEGKLPSWIIRWWSNKQFSKSDISGTDFVVLTDYGIMCLQIKTSETGKNLFEAKKKRCIRVVIINVNDDLWKIFAGVMKVLAEWRHEKMPKPRNN